MTARRPSRADALPMTDIARRALDAELRRLRATLRDHGPGGSAVPDPDRPGRTVAERVEELEHALLHAVVVRPSHPDGRSLAAVGTTVRTDDGRRFADHCLTVGEHGTDDGSGATAVCVHSTVGRALLGRAPGEIVPVVDDDGRTRHHRILRVLEAQ